MCTAAPFFPFTAVVGADQMSLALLLTAVSPEIGGVLVRGEKGTAKSTMVRALTGLLPEVDVTQGCRFSCDPVAPDPTCPDGPHPEPVALARPARLVELPVGTSEDRLVGSLHLHKALAEGVVEYDPGLLAEAHRGLLYVDEVNLLQDHLVDTLLDASAAGRTTVEREGVSISYASRFVLVGTMNPEEGELRPQLLDRFGLTVEVRAPRDPLERVEVVRRRLAYDADPVGFVAARQAEEDSVRQRVARARQAVPGVRLDDAALSTIARVCAGFEVDGMRADLVTARTALAHAAWEARDAVTTQDIRVAARLAIPHRRRRNPFDAPGLDEQVLEDLLAHEPPPPPPPGDRTDAPEGGGVAESGDAEHVGGGPPPAQDSGRADDPSGGDGEADVDDPRGDERPAEPGDRRTPPLSQPASNQPEGTVVGFEKPYRTRLLKVSGTGDGTAGRRSRAYTDTGRTVGQDARARSGPIHLIGTIQAAARRGGRAPGDRVALLPGDLRVARKLGRESNLVLLCVDASGSMAARRRMEQVKTAALSLLLDAYQRRDKVGLITFRGSGAELILPPTSSVDVAARRLERMPAGGRTPLAEGLMVAAETVRLERLRDPRRRPLLVLVTDGRATSGTDALARARQIADRLGETDLSTVVIDCETGRFAMGLAADLAVRLRAEHVPVGEVAADQLTTIVRRRAS